MSSSKKAFFISFTVFLISNISFWFLLRISISLPVCMSVCVCSVAQLYPILCSPMDCRPPGSSVHGILQQEYWNGLPCPPPGDLPHPGTEPASLVSPALTGMCFTKSATFVTWPILSCMLSTFSIKFLSLLIIAFFFFSSTVVWSFQHSMSYLTLILMLVCLFKLWFLLFSMPRTFF